MKRFMMCVLTLMLTLFCVPSLPSFAYSAKSLAVLEPESKTFVESVRGDEVLPMASTTKIMTALVTLENVSLDLEIKVPPCAVGVEGSSMYLVRNEPLSVRELLYGLMLTSGNDAANALAFTVGKGDISAFVSLMNEKAKALGLENTNFTNPSGLPDDNHYTTAKELAILTSAALENPVFAKIVATKSIKIKKNGKENGRTLTNHNKMLSLYDGTIGVKTGYTKKAGRCLVSAAMKNDVTLICVTLNAHDDWNDHIKALDFGFSKFEKTVLAKEREISVPLCAAGGEKVFATNTQPVCAVLPKGAKPVMKIKAPRFVYPPCEKGESVGEVFYVLDGKTVARTELVLETSLDTDIQKELLISKIIKFIRNLF